MEMPLADIELDKIADAGVPTYWRGDDERWPALRLKITHTSFEDPNEVEAEIRAGRYSPFIRIHTFWISACEAAHPDEGPDAWAELPPVFTEEFKAMLRVWGALSEQVSLVPAWPWASARSPR